MMRFSKAWLLLVVLVGLVGCGRAANDGRPNRVPTTVKITHRGTPVEGATVTLVPQEQGSAVAAFGRTDASGTATLGSFGAGDGAVPGPYHVTVTKVEVSELPVFDRDGDPQVVTESLLPEKYGEVEDSGLVATVTESGPNTFSFDLE